MAIPIKPHLSTLLGVSLLTLMAPFGFSWLSLHLSYRLLSLAERQADGTLGETLLPTLVYASPFIVGVVNAAVLCTVCGMIVGQRRLFFLLLFMGVATLWWLVLVTWGQYPLYLYASRWVDVALAFVGSSYGWFALGVYGHTQQARVWKQLGRWVLAVGAGLATVIEKLGRIRRTTWLWLSLALLVMGVVAWIGAVLFSIWTGGWSGRW